MLNLHAACTIKHASIGSLFQLLIVNLDATTLEQWKLNFIVRIYLATVLVWK